MTFIYSLGIFSVMLPVVLGAKALSIFFSGLHDQTYYLGEYFLLILAGFALLGIKLPMIDLRRKSTGKVDVWSSYTLWFFFRYYQFLLCAGFNRSDDIVNFIPDNFNVIGGGDILCFGNGGSAVFGVGFY